MTVNDFRSIALSLPDAVESSHMDHPDFRVRNKIFATLGHPDKTCGMVKLSPPQQDEFCSECPEIFDPVKGGCGLGGATTVHLKSATEEIVRRAMILAWKNAAPKSLAKAFDE